MNRHSEIDRLESQGFIGLLLLGASPIVGDVVWWGAGAALAAIGIILFVRAFNLLGFPR